MNNANKNLRRIVNECQGDSELIAEKYNEIINDEITNVKELKKSIYLVDYEFEELRVIQNKYPHLFNIISYFMISTDKTYISLDDIILYIYSDEMYNKNIIKDVEKDLIKAQFNGIKMDINKKTNKRQIRRK